MTQRNPLGSVSPGPVAALPPLLLAVALLVAPLARAQLTQSAPVEQPATAPTRQIPAALPTVAELDARVTQIEADAELAPDIRSELIATLRKVQDQLRAITTWSDKAAESTAAIQRAPSELDELRTQLAEAEKPAPKIDQSLPLDQLTPQLAQEESALRDAQAEVDRRSAEERTRAERRQQLADLIAAANQRLAAGEAALPGPPAAIHPALADARQTLSLATAEAARTEIRAYEEELRAIVARAEHPAVRSQLAQTRKTRIESRVSALRELVSTKRQVDIARQQAAADESVLDSDPPAIRSFAEQTAAMIQERARLAARIDGVRSTIAATDKRAADFKRVFERVQQMVRDPNLADLIGPAVAGLRQRLDELRTLEREIRADQVALSDAVRRQSDLADERLELADLDARVAELLETQIGPASQQANLQSRTRRLVETRRRAVDELYRDYETFIEQLGGMGLLQARRTLHANLSLAHDFAARLTLWYRSDDPITATRPPHAPQRLLGRAPALLQHTVADITANPAAWILLLAGILVVLRTQWLFRGRLRQLASRVAKVQTDSFAWTIRALPHTIALALPATLALVWIAWRLGEIAINAPAPDDMLARAISQGAWAAATLTFPLAFIRQLCRPAGLGDAHFRWDASNLAKVRSRLILFTPLALGLTFCTHAANAIEEPDWREFVGRLAFLALMLLIALFVETLVRPTSGLFANALRRKQHGRIYHTRWLWYLAIVAIPIALLIASSVGYHYTAQELYRRCLATLWLILAIVLLYALASRALFVARRQLALEQARKKREAMTADAARNDPDAAPKVEVTEERLDVVTLGEQSQQLLRSVSTLATLLGAWLIWSDLLPALGFLQSYTLWTDTSRAIEVGGATQFEKVTALDAAQAILYGVLTYLLVKNIPALLEITLLPRITADHGARYAISAVTRYVIVLVGILVISAELGFGWSRVQWLAAAITVGLGFGLQEIFANFVSGLILLFERPVRVGDTITVNNVSGVVTRIRIRATTIMDWDRKELVIPNKDLVTGSVVNWSLTDRSLRLIIPIGVAYRTDLRLATRLLEEVAAANPRIADDPAPKGYLISFNDSNVNIELRCYLKDLDDIVIARSELMTAIADAFRAENVEIAFPQLDLHLRALPPDRALPLAK